MTLPHLDARIVMSSDQRFLSVLRQAMKNLTLELGWNDADSTAITLAMEEALTNKIRHAYGSRADCMIQFAFRIEKNALIIELTDQGEPPDPAKICAKDRSSATPGGLGTHIIRDVMDRVEYRTVAEGNKVTLTKFLPGEETQEVRP